VGSYCRKINCNFIELAFGATTDFLRDDGSTSVGVGVSRQKSWRFWFLESVTLCLSLAYFWISSLVRIRFRRMQNKSLLRS
jgi:hypothetical protein